MNRVSWQAMARLLVIGSISFDTNWIGTRALRKLGGVVTYAGLTAHRLGCEVTMVTSVGTDGHDALDRFNREGLEFHARIGAASTQFVNAIHGDHRIQRLDAVADPIRAADLRGLDHELVLLGALHPNDVGADALERLASASGRVAADLQGWVRRVEGREVTPGASPLLERVLRIASVIKADPEEIEVAAAALGCAEPEMCGRFGIEELLISNGSRGGRIRFPAGAPVEYAAVPIEAAADSTGAGDVFFAAYLVSRFVRGLAPDAAARAAAEVAARQVAGRWLDDTLLAVDAPA